MTLKILQFLQVYLLCLKKSKIFNAIFVIPPVLASLWQVFIKFRWPDEVLTYRLCFCWAFDKTYEWRKQNPSFTGFLQSSNPRNQWQLHQQRFVDLQIWFVFLKRQTNSSKLHQSKLIIIWGILSPYQQNLIWDHNSVSN